MVVLRSNDFIHEMSRIDPIDIRENKMIGFQVVW